MSKLKPEFFYYWVTWVLGMATGMFVMAGVDISTRLFLLIIGLMIGFGWAALMSGDDEDETHRR